jgi:dienelactone hydrolase
VDASNDSSTGAPEPPQRPLPWRQLILLLLLGVGALASWHGVARLRQQLVFESFRVEVEGSRPVPVTRVRLRGHDAYPAHFLLLHGYVANRSHLLHCGEVLAAAGADVYIPDLPGRGDHTGRTSVRPLTGATATMPTPREDQAALAVLQHAERSNRVPPDRWVLVGHSTGGGVALDLARQIQPAATVSLAGLWRPVLPAMPPNLLLITAQLEIPPLQRAADHMYERARAGNAARRKFLAVHSSLPFHSSVQAAVLEWVTHVLPDAGLAIPQYFNKLLLALEASTLLFLAAVFAPVSGLAGWALGREPYGEVVPETEMSLWSSWYLGSYALAAGAAGVSTLALLAWRGWGHPLSFLRLADGDYLASVLLLATVWLLPVLRRPPWVRSWREAGIKIAVALGLAAYLLLVGGSFLTWQLYDIWPTPGRFARALLLTLILLPYALGEELLVRTCGKQVGGKPLGVRFIWRLGLLTAIVYGAGALESGAGMLVLLVMPITVLSIVQHFFSEAVYRALGSTHAAAVFNAVLLAWFLATVFPLS